MINVYKASAGAGKTHTLTGEYLKLLFANTQNYRKTLAVTFTNKASSEMKERIVESLYKLSCGGDSAYWDMLQEQTGKEKAWIAKKAQAILRDILHNYSFFLIETIDSFFQRIIRNFAKEFGLYSYFNLELNQKDVLEKAIQNMFVNLSEDERVYSIIRDFSNAKIEEGKSRNVMQNLIKDCAIVFKEEFMAKQQQLQSANLAEFYSYVAKVVRGFEDNASGLAKDFMKNLAEAGLSIDDLAGKGRGFAGRVAYIAKKEKLEPFTDSQQEKAEDPEKWTTKTAKNRNVVEAFANAGNSQIVQQICEQFSGNEYIKYVTAKQIKKSEYSLQLLQEVQGKIDEYLKSENLFLISNTNNLINELIGESDAPFVYEKIGCFIENIMIDEFQDTSKFQWKNFKPLLENVLSEQGYALVVGDVKQSIYRFRNGDWKLLHSGVDDAFGSAVKKHNLEFNWRSKRNVIEFNNSLFKHAAEQMHTMFVANLAAQGITYNKENVFVEAYADVAQSIPNKKSNEGGYVCVSNIEGKKDEYLQNVEDYIINTVLTLHQNGFVPGDITFLARGKKEIKFIVETCNKAKILHPNKKHAFSVVSLEALKISSSQVVGFVIAFFKWLANPKCDISKTTMLRLYAVLCENTKRIPAISEFEPIFGAILQKLQHKSLFEVSETIIREFSLNTIESEIAYIHSFQDVLHSYSTKNTLSATDFLQWWSEQKDRLYIAQAESESSMQAITIHKSKGLQFKAVVMPFVDWDYNQKQHKFIVETQNTDFAQLPILEVGFSKDLAKTQLANQYEQEQLQIYLDNLNLLYVACTRAEDALFMAYKNESTSASIGSFLPTVLQQIQGFAEGELEIGTLQNLSNNSSVDLKSQDETYPVYENSGLMLPNPEAVLFFAGKQPIKQRSYGIAMHSVLERTITKGDLYAAVRKAVIDGIIPVEEADGIQASLEQKMQNPTVDDWFSGQYTVLNEQGILLPTSEEKRPDRIMTKGTHAIVVDYKFTEKTAEKHKQQVAEYMQLLLELGFATVEGYVWYPFLDQIILVNC